MLRTLVIALTLAAPTAAMAEQFPHSVLHAEVRAHDGTVVGRVSSVERNAEGRVVAVEIPGQEPPDAPSEQMIAEQERGSWVEVSQRARAGERVTVPQRLSR